MLVSCPDPTLLVQWGQWSGNEAIVQGLETAGHTLTPFDYIISLLYTLFFADTLFTIEHHPPLHSCTCTLSTMCSMVSTLTKLGEGAFAEVFGCQNEDKEKLALKVQSQYTVHK